MDLYLYLRALAQTLTQIAAFSIWTQVTYSILYDDNHYAKHASYIAWLFINTE